MKSGNFNVPNSLSVLRLIGVPYFYWLIVFRQNYGLAIVVLFASGATDWLDGYAARRLNQRTRIGELLDPLVDRLYVTAAIVALVVNKELSIFLLLAFLGRDFFMTILLALLKRRGYSGFPVHFVGKAATMNLLWAFPLVLLGTFDSKLGEISHYVATAFLIWGLALYWYGAFLYAVQYRGLVTVKDHLE
ncbi:MAG: CDP-alcohol phosphatidyltransferase family protein [Actinobacteria bacterium]|nr:CDP-alcohol phosphatidyltransferase family protein [Actinomycetota bacterium]NBY15840.1 CDP-alcohol phosphatidyltransferase family protein [Actinomycetota bacterium]